ncbi:formate dehydrogenase accessory sulfurtransferase FdhD [Chryseobacterium sp. cx-311]|uniref:formate dehydrogenase accessory sulfurtransferase FdhD n=1 Tax=Marnyiella aurantia TaxID=2758037 RepID=UPI001AE33E53|nr:formate dehydrogenase accessory sulfurtransferase FdhD [Marnyiella aurantia]MBP0612567.1 formate dehydrogenase accessory sulfurtransferase FdhD [Marnyiella aurantia]
MTKDVIISKVQNFGKQTASVNDVLAVEEPLEISVSANGETTQLSVTMRTPGNDGELATGFLFTEGIILSANDLNNPPHQSMGENQITVRLKPGASHDMQKVKRNFYTTSSCGVCGKESIEAIMQVCRIPDRRNDAKVNMQHIFTLPDKLRAAQETFNSTGGIHASALFDFQGELISLREDVGRHNALDKLIGAELLKSEGETFFLQDRILLLSGRASFELIQKAAMAGIPVVCAIGAPSSLAVETAEKFGITLIGFLKNGNANIYSGADRVKF